MAKNIIAGENPEFELVAPIKILVKPGFHSEGSEPSSLRRRSITSHELHSGAHRAGGGGRESDDLFLVSDHLKQLAKSERKKEASIQIQDGEKKNVAYYLQHCFRLMYFTGMSTYNPDKKGDDGGKEETWMDTILNGLQKV